MSAEETTNNPGEVIKDDIKITTMYGRTEDITNYVLEVHLFEDIFAPYLSGEIVIDDAADIIQKFPIVGNEKVTLKFRTPTLDDDPINIISKTFFVYGIKERILNNDRGQTYKLKFTSYEHIVNNATTISASFDDQTNEIVKKIFIDNIETERFEDQSVTTPCLIGDTPHKTRVQYVSNGWTPFNNMAYLSRKSDGSRHTGSDFLFYESNKQFYFVSVQHLLFEQKEALFEEYLYTVPGMEIEGRGGGETFIGHPLPHKWQKISQISIPSTIDIVRSQNNGHLANVTRGYDIVTKEYREAYIDTIEDFDKFVTTDEGVPLPAGTKRNAFNMTTAKILNSANYDNYSMNIENSLFNEGTRRSYLQGLMQTKFEITVPGRTDIEIGKMIKLVYPSASEKLTDATYDDLIDPILSGGYLITAIRHKITRTNPTDSFEHVMKMEIVKNGLGKSLGSEE